MILGVSRAIDQLAKDIFDTLKSDVEPLTSNFSILRNSSDTLNQFHDKLAKIKDRFALRKYEKLKEVVEEPEVAEARIALKKGEVPISLGEGISGTYLMRDRIGNTIGVFKPKEEEAGTPGNKKNFGGEKFKAALERSFGVKPGTSYLRERAVYLLDRDHFANVPATFIKKFSHPCFSSHQHASVQREGSFQAFQKNCQHASEMLSLISSYFDSSSSIPASEIHKIGILDVRTLNCDRHLKNFLVDENYQIHPIDHGYTLSKNASLLRFDWMYFDQSKKPFSENELAYIESLNPNEDARILRELGIEEEAITRLTTATLLLKAAARKGLSLYQIGDLMLGAGKHKPRLMQLIHAFFPITKGAPSYFESYIYPRVQCYSYQRDVSQVLEEQINQYLQKNARGFFSTITSLVH